MKLFAATAAALLTLAGAAVANPAQVLQGAAPQAGGASMIQQVHGCHRYAQDDERGWHRHVGPNCRRVKSDPTEQNPYARCRTKCYYVGPIKQCDRICD